MTNFHNLLYVSLGTTAETGGLKQAISLARNNRAEPMAVSNVSWVLASALRSRLLIESRSLAQKLLQQSILYTFQWVHVLSEDLFREAYSSDLRKDKDHSRNERGSC